MNGRRAMQPHLAHVRYVEQSGLGAGMQMLGDDAGRVLHRHVIAGKADHAGTAGAMQIVEGRP